MANVRVTEDDIIYAWKKIEQPSGAGYAISGELWQSYQAIRKLYEAAYDAVAQVGVYHFAKRRPVDVAYEREVMRHVAEAHALYEQLQYAPVPDDPNA